VDSEDTNLDLEESPHGDVPPQTALARLRAVSVALSDAARRSRLSSRRTASLSSGGFGGRSGARFVRYLLVGTFLTIVVAPTLAALTYFEFIAADQYVAESDFTVSAGESPLRDGIASLTGLPGLAILQDTQIITNFIHSRAAADKLEQRVGLRNLYSTDRADYFARFDAKKPIERFVKYWSKVSTATIKMPGGIVRLSVRAFSPEDAQRVAAATIAICEELVNGLNERINQDAVALAETELHRASERMSKALAALEVARNQSGILETSASAEVINTLLKQQKSTLLSLSGLYETQLKYMNPDAPQMRDMKVRIDVMRQQIADLQGQLTTSPQSAVDPGLLSADKLDGGTVAEAMTKFGELDVERKVAEHLYTTAATALEHARIAAENKMIYLKIFVRPNLPQQSEYPARGLNVFLVAVSSLAAWGFLVAVGAVVRNNMA
jgi:capsular polysaccharide transport system permease protein